jgi:hypothetical protein
MTDETPDPAPADDTVTVETDSAELDGSDPAKPAAARRRLTPLTITLISVAAALVLAVGVTATIGYAGGQVTAVETPEPSVAPSESATPEPVKVEAPLPRLDATCEQLVPPGVRASLFGSSLRPVDGGSGDRWPALAQAGGMSCSWSATGAGMQELWGHGLSLTLMPDAESGYLDKFSGYPMDNYTTVDSAGDRSRLTCNIWDDKFSCSADLLQSGYWAEISINGVPTAGTDEDALAARAQALLETAADVVATAPERPPYVITPGAFDGATLCRQTGIARTQQVWGQQVSEEVPWFWEHYGIDAVVSERQPELGCVHVLPGDRTVGYNTLPGGAWAVDAMLARSPLEGYIGTYSRASIPGADAALIACNADTCQAAVSYRSSYVEFRSWNDRALLEQKVAEIIASLEG